MQLTLAAQINAVNELTRLSHLDALSGDVKSAVHLLNRARGLMEQVLRNVGSDNGSSPSWTQERNSASAHESSNDDSKLLDEISQAQLGKAYSKANETQQQIIRQLAGKVLGREVNTNVGQTIRTSDALRMRTAANPLPLPLTERPNRRKEVGTWDTEDAKRNQNDTGAVGVGQGAVGQISYKQWLRENKTA